MFYSYGPILTFGRGGNDDARPSARANGERRVSLLTRFSRFISPLFFTIIITIIVIAPPSLHPRPAVGRRVDEYKRFPRVDERRT